jgi:DNA-binding IclR family transcriptional regulator
LIQENFNTTVTQIMTIETTKQQQGIQSIEIGAQLLRALVANGRAMKLKDLAKSVKMPAAKAHRYLVSFIRMGLVEQDVNTGSYGLGAFALELGLASLARIDAVRLADPILANLCEEIGETVALSVWGSHGATCVRLIEAGGPITLSLRTGVVMPLTTSATGLAYAAFYQSPSLKQWINVELRAIGAATNTTANALLQNLEDMLKEVRSHGISRAGGSMTPGVNGFSAPVYDHTGRMVAAITSLGTVGHFDMEWESPLAQSIKDAASTLSKRLGYGQVEPANLSIQN